MLRAILNMSWRQLPTKHQVYDDLPPIMKTIQIRRTRHAGYCWRSIDELISDVLQWITTYGRANAGWPARTYIQKLCEDTGYNPENLPEAINDRECYIFIYIDSCRIHTDTMNNRRTHNRQTHAMTKTQEDFFNKICIPLTLFVMVQKGYSRFACERELEIEHNCNILTPTFMAVNVVSFSFFWCSTGGPEATLLGDGFLYGILSASSPDLNSSGPKGPLRPDVAFPTTSLSNCLQLNCRRTQLAWLLSWLSYIIAQRPLDRPRDLWNRIFNRHQAEITVLQFRGHSLPVSQSMRVSWDFFYLVPFHLPISAHAISSHNCH